MALAVLQGDCKTAVLSLSTLSNTELDEIMNNEDKIDEILLSMDKKCLQTFETEKEELLASNGKLSEENLSREPELVEGREKFKELSDTFEQLSKVVEEKTKEFSQKAGDMSLEIALALLQTVASEIEEESDKFAKKFLANEVELDEFVDQFLAKRKLMHLRLVKAEKMSKILSRDPMGNSNYANTPPLSINSNFFPGVPMTSFNPIPSSVPYPTGPVNMPLPPGMGGYFANHY